MPDQPFGSPNRSVLSAELREILAFNEAENQKHRAFFESLYKTTVSALTVILLLLGGLVAFVGWHTISDIRKQAQDATAEEIKATRLQSQQAMDQEIQSMRLQISKRLDNEFQTRAIRETVGDAARRQTQAAMMPLINREVQTQVSKGVSAEQGSIQATLVAQTKTAIEEMKPIINTTIESRVGGVVDASVKKQVDTQITPVLQQLQNNQQISKLIIQAESGDGQSFDMLARIAFDSKQDPDFKASAYRTFSAVMISHNSAFYNNFHFTDSATPAEKITRLSSPDALQRRCAIDELTVDYAKQHMDQLFSIMTSDADLSVREAAYIKFKSVAGNNFLNLDTATATTWWAKHRSEFISEKK